MKTTNTMKEKGRKHTTHEQLQCFVNFSKEHPEIQTEKNNPLPPQALQNLWEEVSKDLNEIKGPTRTASEWKVNLLQWKKLIQMRAHKAKEKRIDQLFKIAMGYKEAQKIREKRILESNRAMLEAQNIREERILASNLSLQQTLETLSDSFATLAEILVKNAKEKQ